jgi:transposase InsO family protein
MASSNGDVTPSLPLNRYGMVFRVCAINESIAWINCSAFSSDFCRDFRDSFGARDGVDRHRSTLEADITYIRLETEFVYLAVVLDAYSRRVIGWALDRTLEDELTIAALRMALERRVPAPGLVHHSDRGIQYASRDYTDLLKDNQIKISMSRKGNPYDKDSRWLRCHAVSADQIAHLC